MIPSLCGPHNGNSRSKAPFWSACHFLHAYAAKVHFRRDFAYTWICLRRVDVIKPSLITLWVSRFESHKYRRANLWP
jgi:hypothetical protein